MQVSLKKGLGNSLLNAIRGAAYVCYPTIRPVGYKVGGSSTVVGISDSVIEDMTTFIGNVDSCVFSYSGNAKIIQAKAVCNGTLTISQLLEGTGIGVNTDVEVLHSIAPIDVSVIFSLNKGNFMIDENTNLLHDCGHHDHVVVNSRHCILDAFTFKQIDSLESVDVFDVTIKTVDGTDPKTVFDHAVKTVNNCLQSLTPNIS